MLGSCFRTLAVILFKILDNNVYIATRNEPLNRSLQTESMSMSKNLKQE